METYFPTNTQHIPYSEQQSGGAEAGNRKEIENCQSLEHLVSSSELPGSCLPPNWIICILTQKKNYVRLLLLSC